ncbi:MAG: RHS repeat-associated core domain-containing protein [Planctomycetota bacterium]
MARLARQYGRVLLYVLPLVLIAAFFALRPHQAEGGTPYSDPFWDHTSSYPECSACSGCGCPSAPEFTQEGVSARTGELVVDIPLFSFPGRVEPLVFSLRYRSMLDGTTQMGNNMVPSWETTAEKVILNAGSPNSSGGHEWWIRRPSGLIDVWGFDGVDYYPDSCLVTDALTINGSGNPVLTDKHGNEIVFDAQGMPYTHTDRNGNVVTTNYDSSRRLQSISGTRGESYTVTLNANDYIETIGDPASQEWDFTYDSSDNLSTITSPATPDQTSGITRTLYWDAYNRLTGIEDGNGNTVNVYAYVGTTGQIDKVTVDSVDVEYAYTAGTPNVTTRTDQNGGVHRYLWTGQVVEQTDMWISSAAEYVTEYRHSGNVLTAIVRPLGGRTDFTWDGNYNLTEVRRRTTDTSTNDASDIVDSYTFNSSNFMLTHTNSLGDVTTYTVDGNGNRTATTFETVTNPATQTASTSATYNGYGQLATSTDEEGTVTSYTYYSTGLKTGLLETVRIDSTGLDITTTYDYNDAGDATSVTDPRGYTTTRTFDALRRLTQTQAPSPLSYRVQNEYDGNSNLTERRVENIDKDGTQSSTHPWITTNYTYTDRDQLATIVEDVTSSTTRTTEFQYDDNGNRTLLIKPEGNKEAWTYNERDLVATHVRGYTDADASTRTYGYDDNGNPTTFTNGRSYTTTTTFDAFDRRTKVTNAAGHYTEFTLDELGQITGIEKYDSSHNLLQRESRYYDERGRLWKTSGLRKDPSTTYSDAVTTYSRLKTGQVATVTDAVSSVTTNTYDAAGRLIEVEDHLGNTVTYTLDDGGLATAWEIEETDGTSTVTHEYEAVYDAIGRKTVDKEIDRTNGSNVLETEYYYDSRSNRTFLVDAMDNPTRWTFDANGRMTKRERALSLGSTINDFTTAQVTEWGFDDNDRMTSHTDDGSNATTWAHDALDRVVTMTHPDTTYVTYGHDAEDNVVETIDAAGNEIDDTFDNLDRNTARSITVATGFGGTTSETRTYDGLNRMLTNDDDDYDLTFTHAVVGLKSMVYSEEQAYATGTAYSKTVTKVYDAMGRKATEAYPGGMNLTYVRNGLGQLTSVNDGTTTVGTYTYWGSREKGVTFGNGATQSNTYGGFRQEVTSIHHQDSGAGTLVRMDYGYNAVHDRTYERFGALGASGEAFEYDKMRRLTKAWMGSAKPSSPSGQVHTETIDFNMDDDGNRTSKVHTPYLGSPVSTSYTTNSLNQYTAVGAASLTYDGNGNLVDDGTYYYEYDYRNQLIEVGHSGGAVIATYRYDAMGRRVEKNVSGPGITRFILSGLEVIETCAGQTTWAQSFVYADGIDHVVSMRQADILDWDADLDTVELVWSYYHRNALGSVMFISEPDETEAATYRYSPYGEIAISRGGFAQGSDPLDQDIGYTGRWYDAEAGLWQFRFRAYSGVLGRFLQRDPIGLRAGPTLYLYAEACPATYVDPLGLDSVSWKDGPGLDEQGRVVGCFDLSTDCPPCKMRFHLSEVTYAADASRGEDRPPIECKRKCRWQVRASAAADYAAIMRKYCIKYHDLEDATAKAKINVLAATFVAVARASVSGGVGGLILVLGTIGGQVAADHAIAARHQEKLDELCKELNDALGALFGANDVWECK